MFLSCSQVVTPASVRHTLTLMHSCGMYDFSGEFAFNVSLMLTVSRLCIECVCVSLLSLSLLHFFLCHSSFLLFFFSLSPIAKAQCMYILLINVCELLNQCYCLLSDAKLFHCTVGWPTSQEWSIWCDSCCCPSHYGPLLVQPSSQ